MASHIAALDRSRPVPGVLISLRQQTWLLGASRRWFYLTLVMLAALVFARFVAGPAELPLPFAVAVFGVPFGLFWALAVWQGEGPHRRLYHWSLPVARPAHDLARVVAGVPWLLLAYAVLAAAGAGIALLDGTYARFGAIDPVAWANYFGAPVIVYLLSMPLVLWRDYAITRRVLTGWIGVCWVGLALSFVVDLAWLGALVDPWFYDSSRALAAALFDVILNELTGAGATAHGWWTPALVWLAIGTTLTVFTAVFRPDDVRRLFRRG